MENFEYKEISELRILLDTKAVSSVELTKYFLARVKAQNAELNAFITVTEEQALIDADRADEFIGSPGENPALCGIPYAAKDLFNIRGTRTTAASKILDNYISPYTATSIKKIQDQFAHGSSGETSSYGPAHNPWDKTRMPGGSSSGSASAVAAGLVPWATATETGGSIRQPASLSGISGWKPTYGRVSRYGVIAMGSSLDSIGAMAYSVKDLAMIAEVMSGMDEKDSTTGHQDVPAFSLQLKSEISNLKIGIPKQYFIDGMEAAVKQRVMDAIHELEKLGAKLVEVDLPNTKYGSLVYAIICPSEVSSNLARYDGIRYGYVTKDANDLLDVYEKSRAEGFGNEAKRRILTGTYVLSAGYYDAYYKRAQKVRQLIVNEFTEVFKQVDVLACPSTPSVAAKLGAAAENPLHGYIADQLNIPGSLAGLPALSIPAGFARPSDGGMPSMDGLPIGLQIIGPQWGEQKIFDVGHAYQQATDWHRKHPAV